MDSPIRAAREKQAVFAQRERERMAIYYRNLKQIHEEFIQALEAKRLKEESQ